MKYKGIELKEVTEPQLFDPPKKMLVWDKDSVCPAELDVYAIVNRKVGRVVITENTAWQHCAEIPEITESKFVTYRELARWIAKGNGEAKIVKSVFIHWTYAETEANDNVGENISVRKWDDTEWHKPTREYLGLED